MAQKLYKSFKATEPSEQREQSQACLDYAESRRNSATGQFGMHDERFEEGDEVISRGIVELSMDRRMPRHTGFSTTFPPFWKLRTNVSNCMRRSMSPTRNKNKPGKSKASSW